MLRQKLTCLSSVFLIFATDGFAKKTEPPAKIKAGYELSENQLPAAYNASARVNIENSWDFFVNASLIYWQPQEGSLDVANYYSPTQTECVSMSLDFHPGFKLAIGLNSGFDDWDTYIEYCRLHTSDENNYQTPSWASSVLNTFSNNAVDSLSATFKLHYDMLEWSLGRYFYNGKKLSLRPSFGLKGGWINQYLNTSGPDHDLPSYSAISSTKSTSWLIGPNLGLDGRWFLGCGFRLFTNFNAALLYQSFEAHETDTYHITTYSYSKSPKGVTPNLGTTLGLGWGTYLNKHKDHFDLSFGYEFQYYFHQNDFFKILFSNTFQSTFDALMLQGLSVKAQFDF